MNLRVVSMLAALASITACKSPPSEQPLPDSRGARLYRSLCASCHGVDARGEGRIAPLLKVPVPDLTTLAQRNGGHFPSYSVRRSIDGRFDRPAHGTRDMPVWGWQLYDTGIRDVKEARARTDDRIDELVAYLASLQQ